MDRPSRLPILAFALLVLLAGCTSVLPPSASTTGAPAAGDGDAVPAAQATDTPGPTTISVSGSAERSTDADQAVVSVAAVARTDSADDARAEVASDVAELRAALREVGVPADAVTTAQYRVSPRYDYRNERQRLLGYEAVHALRIEVTPDQAGVAVDAAVGAGADRVDGVQFTLRDETRADLRTQALEQAVASARADADAVAGAAGLTVTGVESIQVGSGYTPVPYAVERADGGGGGGAPTTFQPGPVTVRASVQVVYQAG